MIESIYYTAHIKAEPQSEFRNFGSSQVELSAGYWYGMGGWKQESWEISKEGVHFPTLQDAKDYIRGLPLVGYGYKIDPDEKPYFRKHRVVTEHYVEDVIE